MNYIFIVLYIIMAMVALAIERKNYRRHITPLLFFSLVWCIVGIGANLGLYNYYYPSDEVNFMILTVVFVFTLFWTAIDRNTGTLFQDLQTNKCEMDIGVFGLLCMEIIIVVVIFPRLKESINMLRSGKIANMAVLRGSVYSYDSDSGYSSELIELLVRPAITTISVLAAVSLFNKTEKYGRVMIWSFNVFNILIYTVATAGRMTIVNMFFYMIISIAVFSGDKLVSFITKNKKQLVIFIAIFIAILIMQNQRQAGTSILKTIYMYYFSGPGYLSRILVENDSIFRINHEFMFGTATFGFLSNFVSYGLILITHKSQGSLYMLGSVLTNTSYEVGINMKLNAMCTCIYVFLLDWGYLGLIIGPIVVASIGRYLYFKARYSDSFIYKCLLVFYINVLIRTIFKWDLLGFDFSMLCFYLYFLKKSNRIKFVKG